MAHIIYFLLLALYALGVAVLVMSIGKPRRPVTPGVALAALVVNSGQMAGILYLYLQAVGK